MTGSIQTPLQEQSPEQSSVCISFDQVLLRDDREHSNIPARQQLSTEPKSMTDGLIRQSCFWYLSLSIIGYKLI